MKKRINTPRKNEPPITRRMGPSKGVFYGGSRVVNYDVASPDGVWALEPNWAGYDYKLPSRAVSLTLRLPRAIVGEPPYSEDDYPKVWQGSIQWRQTLRAKVPNAALAIAFVPFPLLKLVDEGELCGQIPGAALRMNSASRHSAERWAPTIILRLIRGGSSTIGTECILSLAGNSWCVEIFGEAKVKKHQAGKWLNRCGKEYLEQAGADTELGTRPPLTVHS